MLQLIISLVNGGLITTIDQAPYNFVDCEFQMVSSLDVNKFFLDVNLSTKKQENRDGTNYE